MRTLPNSAIMDAVAEDTLKIGRRLQERVLEPMKAAFVGKAEIIDLLGLCLAGGENLFILGPPGTAKSALVHYLGRRLEGETFEYLLTRFTEPNELFGPFDIRKLRDGVLETNTEGMLPEASLVFLDELLNANSAILNSLLTVLNERVLRRGRQMHQLPLLTVIGASNHLPEEESLRALFDRFLLRVRSENVEPASLEKVLVAGWQLEHELEIDRDQRGIGVEEIRRLQVALPSVQMRAVLDVYVALIGRIRALGLHLSDRRAVKLQRLVAASALLCGRDEAMISDLWILRHVWDHEDQQELLAALVDETISEATASEGAEHPRGREHEAPDPEMLASDLEYLESVLPEMATSGKEGARDRLSLLATRSQWVENQEQRQALKTRIDALWEAMG